MKKTNHARRRARGTTSGADPGRTRRSRRRSGKSGSGSGRTATTESGRMTDIAEAGRTTGGAGGASRN